MTEFRKTKLIPTACALMLAAMFPSAMRSQQAPAPQAQMPSLQLPAAQAPAGPAASSGPRLTLAEAERMAIEHNANISVARLIALAQAQVTREVRSGELPTATGSLTAVGAHENSRVTAGLLNNPSIFDRAAGGLTVSQLITDFGRTHNLVRSAQSNAKAQLENERATELDITLAVDQAFYQALTSQAVLKVAEETVNQRQATVDQVGALTKAKLRSDLDLSFANVQISQAKLLLLDAQNSAADAMASLNTVLGSERDEQYTLVDETTANPEPAPQDAEALLQAAFTARPDLAALNDNYTAARQFSTAERELWMPTVSALAAVGGTPVRADQIQSSWYGAAGANISIPVFNGFLYNARAQEAKLRANAAGEQVRNLRQEIARDLRIAVLNAQNAFQRIGVTQEMLNESNMALDLSQARYKIGLSGIVELTQAQLAQTQAEIAYANARYAYQTALAVVRFQTGQ
ncbi:MAG TPA: TolC family protein [Terracidiphilus sp.]|jgi:outer membrane protein|nr:TolC family protein [Terracidiphilus sp.]